MLHLENGELRLDVLDPTHERHLLGLRFCSGGYIWQVHDPSAGPLVTGPQWPHPTPGPYNGQGLPESFRHRTREGRPLTWTGQRGVACGVGEIASDANGDVSLVEPCTWTIAREPDRLVFQTRHTVAGFDCEVTRRLILTGRTVVSESQLTNHADEPMGLEWFAHPFFATGTNGAIRAGLPMGMRLPDNPGFSIEDQVLTPKRPFTHERDGHMDFLQFPPLIAPEFRINHPTLTGVKFTPSFAPSECVVWGNHITFSIEPYHVLNVPPGGTQQWSLRYDFGTVSKIVSDGSNARRPD